MPNLTASLSAPAPQGLIRAHMHVYLAQILIEFYVRYASLPIDSCVALSGLYHHISTIYALPNIDIYLEFVLLLCYNWIVFRYKNSIHCCVIT
jgi:hypothetical protein